VHIADYVRFIANDSANTVLDDFTHN